MLWTADKPPAIKTSDEGGLGAFLTDTAQRPNRYGSTRVLRGYVEVTCSVVFLVDGAVTNACLCPSVLWKCYSKYKGDGVKPLGASTIIVVLVYI